MRSKRKRDEQADFEKNMLLDPGKVRQKKKRKRRKLAAAVAVQAILIVALLVIAFQIFRAVGKSSLLGKAQAAMPDLAPVQAREALTDEEKDRWQEGWVKYQDTVYAYKDDILTFLFMGIDKNSDVKEVAEGTDGGQADALFLAVVDPGETAIKIIGINRNTMADIDIYNQEGSYVAATKAQIAVQHGFGNGMEESCEYQVRAVSKLFHNLPIHGYAAINMSAISTINDTVGGVDVTVLEDLTAKDRKLVKDAKVHLEGESAFWYVKYRDMDTFGSADRRLNRQRQYLEKFIDAAKQVAGKDISIAVDLYQAVASQMVTDISLDEVAYLAPVLINYRFNTDSFYMLQGQTVMGEKFEEFYVDEKALYELVLEVFYEEITF